MSHLVAALEKTILEHNLACPGERLLVGVSGGMDSVALVHALQRLPSKRQLKMVVAHFNHGLRGSASDGDEAFVRGLAADLGLPCAIGRGNVAQMARDRHISIEMAARAARHQFFVRAARAWSASKIALAHHADDQLEQFFLKVFRGSGPDALRGMRVLSPSPASARLMIIRPLLATTRKQIAAFVQEHGLRFRHDATNDQLHCDRNKVRHELLPFAREKFGPAVDSAVLRLMAIIRCESELLERLTGEAIGTAAQFETLHPALQRRWLQSKCLAAGVEPSFEMIEALRTRRPGQRWMIAPSRSIWRDLDGGVHVAKVDRRTFRAEEKDLQLVGADNGIERFGHLELRWRIVPWRGQPPPSLPKASGIERFDADRVGTRIRLRHWRTGDRFQPIGLKVPAKVQNLLTNSKIPAEDRVRLTLAEAEFGEIFWIEGLRISEMFKLNPETRRCLEWRWMALGAEECFDLTSTGK